MDNNKVENPKVEVPSTPEMNDRDYLNDVLECEKNISNNLATAISEASHQALFQDIFDMFTESKNSARQLYNLMFQKGWYCLEKAEATKVTQKMNELSQKLTELPQ
ncbi:MAG: spore coat protein [Bacilli bacterium]|nr:spore coat protein [Bacilli bacterium]MDD4608071.1 spore coat protein [Bacilli bacterium]